MQLSWKPYQLEFTEPAVTSRGSYTHKTSWLLSLCNGNSCGTGEASPLPDLSRDGQQDLVPVMEQMQLWLLEGLEIPQVLEQIEAFPSLQFALECAWLDMQSGGNGILFENSFTQKKSPIPINGLVWMNDTDAMLQQALKKAASGFSVIKFKVGAKDHDAECRMLEAFRKKHNAFAVEIRLDANGAFDQETALEILHDFSKFDIHSVEQPIKAGQAEAMADIVAKSATDIALDEELISCTPNAAETLLKLIRPAYIVLKPTLIGGFRNCDYWINTAYKHNIGWWATSALEGNVGLGHIAQWTASKPLKMVQGLGTGALFRNNFPATTYLSGDQLWFGGNQE